MRTILVADLPAPSAHRTVDRTAAPQHGRKLPLPVPRKSALSKRSLDVPSPGIGFDDGRSTRNGLLLAVGVVGVFVFVYVVNHCIAVVSQKYS